MLIGLIIKQRSALLGLFQATGDYEDIPKIKSCYRNLQEKTREFPLWLSPTLSTIRTYNMYPSTHKLHDLQPLNLSTFRVHDTEAYPISESSRTIT